MLPVVFTFVQFVLVNRLSLRHWLFFLISGEGSSTPNTNGLMPRSSREAGDNYILLQVLRLKDSKHQ